MQQNAPSGDDSRRDEAILLLARGGARGAVAEQIGIDRSTLWRWMQDDTFVQAVTRARAEVFSEAVGVLLANARGAALHLSKLAVGVHDPDDDGRLRLQACTRLLSFSHNLGQLIDLETRITALEEEIPA